MGLEPNLQICKECLCTTYPLQDRGEKEINHKWDYLSSICYTFYIYKMPSDYALAK